MTSRRITSVTSVDKILLPKQRLAATLYHFVQKLLCNAAFKRNLIYDVSHVRALNVWKIVVLSPRRAR
jgi:hypothetical protein